MELHTELILRMFINFVSRWIIRTRHSPLLGKNLGMYINRTRQRDSKFEAIGGVAWKLLEYLELTSKTLTTL